MNSLINDTSIDFARKDENDSLAHFRKSFLSKKKALMRKFFILQVLTGTYA